MNRLPVSVCLISGAEAHRIGRTLAGVAGWAAEIIVVLNEEVTDGTDQVAAQYGAQVFREPWRGFTAQKNSAAAKATQPWLLNVDADEVPTPELAAEIQALLGDSRRAELHAAYSMPRLSFYCGRWIHHGDWRPDRKVRLWQRGRAVWEGAGLHERLVVQGSVGRLRADLLHYSMESLNRQITKTMQYADAFAAHAAQTGQTSGFLDLLVRPAWRFLRGYVFRAGFLDGWQGFAIAWLTAFYTFLRYARVREDRVPKPPATV